MRSATPDDGERDGTVTGVREKADGASAADATRGGEGGRASEQPSVIEGGRVVGPASRAVCVEDGEPGGVLGAAARRSTSHTSAS